MVIVEGVGMRDVVPFLFGMSARVLRIVNISVYELDLCNPKPFF